MEKLFFFNPRAKLYLDKCGDSKSIQSDAEKKVIEQKYKYWINWLSA